MFFCFFFFFLSNKFNHECADSRNGEVTRTHRKTRKAQGKAGEKAEERIERMEEKGAECEKCDYRNPWLSNPNKGYRPKSDDQKTCERDTKVAERSVEGREESR